MRESLADKDAEIRIMKRERDEERDKKFDSLIEIKRLKVNKIIQLNRKT